MLNIGRYRLRIGMFNSKSYSDATNHGKTHYEILEVNPDADFEEIKGAFIKKSKSLHPDATASDGKDTHEDFVDLNNAYSILSKPESRRDYDVLIKSTGTSARNIPSPYKSRSNVRNPYRSASYKNPYTEYNQQWQNADRWTDYYNTYGRSRAKRRMQQDINEEFWQKHWKHAREYGSGKPQFATHRLKKNKHQHLHEIRYMLLVMCFFSLLPLFVYFLSPRGKMDLEEFHKEHAAWLLSKHQLKDFKLQNPHDLKFDQSKSAD